MDGFFNYVPKEEKKEEGQKEKKRYKHKKKNEVKLKGFLKKSSYFIYCFYNKL